MTPVNALGSGTPRRREGPRFGAVERPRPGRGGVHAPALLTVHALARGGVQPPALWTAHALGRGDALPMAGPHSRGWPPGHGDLACRYRDGTTYWPATLGGTSKSTPGLLGACNGLARSRSSVDRAAPMVESGPGDRTSGLTSPRMGIRPTMTLVPAGHSVDGCRASARSDRDHPQPHMRQRDGRPSTLVAAVRPVRAAPTHRLPDRTRPGRSRTVPAHRSTRRRCRRQCPPSALDPGRSDRASTAWRDLWADRGGPAWPYGLNSSGESAWGRRSNLIAHLVGPTGSSIAAIICCRRMVLCASRLNLMETHSTEMTPRFVRRPPRVAGRPTTRRST